MIMYKLVDLVKQVQNMSFYQIQQGLFNKQIASFQNQLEVLIRKKIMMLKLENSSIYKRQIDDNQNKFKRVQFIRNFLYNSSIDQKYTQLVKLYDKIDSIGSIFSQNRKAELDLSRCLSQQIKQPNQSLILKEINERLKTLDTSTKTNFQNQEKNIKFLNSFVFKSQEKMAKSQPMNKLEQRLKRISQDLIQLKALKNNKQKQESKQIALQAQKIRLRQQQVINKEISIKSRQKQLDLKQSEFKKYQNIYKQNQFFTNRAMLQIKEFYKKQKEEMDSSLSQNKKTIISTQNQFKSLLKSADQLKGQIIEKNRNNLQAFQEKLKKVQSLNQQTIKTMNSQFDRQRQFSNKTINKINKQLENHQIEHQAKLQKLKNQKQAVQKQLNEMHEDQISVLNQKIAKQQKQVQSLKNRIQFEIPEANSRLNQHRFKQLQQMLQKFDQLEQFKQAQLKQLILQHSNQIVRKDTQHMKEINKLKQDLMNQLNRKQALHLQALNSKNQLHRSEAKRLADDKEHALEELKSLNSRLQSEIAQINSQLSQQRSLFLQQTIKKIYQSEKLKQTHMKQLIYQHSNQIVKKDTHQHIVIQKLMQDHMNQLGKTCTLHLLALNTKNSQLLLQVKRSTDDKEKSLKTKQIQIIKLLETLQEYKLNNQKLKKSHLLQIGDIISYLNDPNANQHKIPIDIKLALKMVFFKKISVCQEKKRKAQLALSKKQNQERAIQLVNQLLCQEIEY